MPRRPPFATTTTLESFDGELSIVSLKGCCEDFGFKKLAFKKNSFYEGIYIVVVVAAGCKFTCDWEC